MNIHEIEESGNASFAGFHAALLESFKSETGTLYHLAANLLIAFLGSLKNALFSGFPGCERLPGVLSSRVIQRLKTDPRVGDLPPLKPHHFQSENLEVVQTKGSKQMPRGKKEQAPADHPQLREVEVEVGRGKTVDSPISQPKTMAFLTDARQGRHSRDGMAQAHDSGFHSKLSPWKMWLITCLSTDGETLPSRIASTASIVAIFAARTTDLAGSPVAARLLRVTSLDQPRFSALVIIATHSRPWVSSIKPVETTNAGRDCRAALSV